MSRYFDYLYVISAPESKAMKIGMTRDPYIRARDLQTASPFDLSFDLLFAFDWDGYGNGRSVARQAESYLHDELKEHRLRGEWFRRSAINDIQPMVERRFSNSIAALGKGLRVPQSRKMYVNPSSGRAVNHSVYRRMMRGYDWERRPGPEYMSEREVLEYLSISDPKALHYCLWARLLPEPKDGVWHRKDQIDYFKKNKLAECLLAIFE